MHSIVKYCFPFFLILRILRGTHRTDLFVEVTNLMKVNTVWAHFTLTGYYPTSIRLSRDNDLTHIYDDHFEINLKAHLLKYV